MIIKIWWKCVIFGHEWMNAHDAGSGAKAMVPAGDPVAGMANNLLGPPQSRECDRCGRVEPLPAAPKRG